MASKQIRHLIYCMGCNKNMFDRLISLERAIQLVDNPSSLVERYVLMHNRKTGAEELLEENCCDECYHDETGWW